ncbi:hypothetical protein OLN68_11200, partial [Citrobacter freundii]|nr:hypothetical protein [Citrobacter freundii]MCW1446219.1 hypothetical protein [Citrobacter freundii]
TGGIPTAPLFGRDLKKCMELKRVYLQTHLNLLTSGINKISQRSHSFPSSRFPAQCEFLKDIPINKKSLFIQMNIYYNQMRQ